MASLLTQTQTWVPSRDAQATRPIAVTVLLWVAQISMAEMFVMAAIPKLAGDPQMIGLFDALGVGQWFRYATGAIELAGAVLLLVPRLALFGAIALAATMVGAIITHLFIVGGSPLLPIVLLGVTTAIGWARWSER